LAEKDNTEELEERKSRRKQRQKDQHEKAKSWLREWMDALLFAAIAALIIRTFFFEAYRIPTPSMEETLLTGDFLVVSKISYGPRTPMTLSFPFTNIYLPGVNLPWTRIPGYEDIERNDIVVFNYPIDIAPIAVKTNYIKRCVGIPGDTLSIRDKELFVNSQSAENFPGIQKHYIVRVQERVRLSPAKVNAAGAELIRAEGPNSYRVNMTEEEAAEKTEFDVVISSVGDKKIQVIKVVRAITGLGLKEAKALVDGLPGPVKEGVPKEEAEDVQKQLEEAGATVEIK